jgi:hypothetical protein
MPKRQTIPEYSFDLTDPESARSMAQDIADKTGREIVVSDADGNEVWRVHPTRHNELPVRSKALN